jgi:hypothetical protein
MGGEDIVVVGEFGVWKSVLGRAKEDWGTISCCGVGGVDAGTGYCWGVDDSVGVDGSL